MNSISAKSQTDQGQVHKYSSVQDIGFASEQNPQFRQTMEDEHIFIDDFVSHKQGYVAVYDGIFFFPTMR